MKKLYNTVGWQTTIKPSQLTPIFHVPRLRSVGFFRWFFCVLSIVLMAGVYVIADPYPPLRGGMVMEITSANATDSTYIDSTIAIGKTNGARTAIGIVHVKGPISAYAGAGLDDSCSILIKSIGQGRTRTHTTATCAAIPCSCLFAIETATIDSILMSDLYIDVIVVDSLSDTAVVLPYSIDWDVTFK